jgi:glucosamine-6-phosphate deaminase
VSVATRDLVVGEMSVRVHADPEHLAQAAADDAARALRSAIHERGRAHAMFATGNSQLEFLAVLTARDDVDWPRVIGFHMDEYLGLSADHPASFRRYLRERLVERVDIGAFHPIEGDAADPARECERYAALLGDHPLDLCCLGIGENGHLAFNDPPVADFADPRDVKIVDLDDACRRQQVGEGHFPSIDAVPAQAITVTIPALLRAASVLAIVPEARKRDPVHRALYGPVEVACPASVLRTQAHVTLHLDAESGAAVGAEA